ncbi:MAG: aspartate kinase [Thermomicrobiales bacterium]
MIVLKFGGTSVGTLERVRDAASIIEAQAKPRAVVVSAASGVTNMLLDAARLSAAGDMPATHVIVEAIEARHHEIIGGIQSDEERKVARSIVDALHGELRRDLDEARIASSTSPALSDQIVSIGERSMSVMMAATLRDRGTPAAHVFAHDVIATDDRHGNARPDRHRTREQAEERVRPLLDGGLTVIMTGFIGGAPDGSITTLGRGGSDYSATLLGAALMAEEVQIWTDVPGVLTADPRVVKNTRVVPQISFDEAQELAHFGAKVLHPRTIRPAVALDIPVRILSTFAPQEPGTLITRESSNQQLKAVSVMSGLQLLTVDVPELEDLSGAASKVFGTLYEDRVEVVLVSQASSRRRMTYLIDGTSSGGCDPVLERLADSLQDFEAIVGCTPDVAIVAAVGHGAAEQPKALSQLLAALGREAIPILASSQQASNAALVAAIPSQFAERALQAVHREFIRPQAESGRLRRRRRSQLMGEAMRVG